MSDVTGDDADHVDIVATPDMCHHCFDVLLRELVPEPSLRSHRGGGSPSKRNKQSTKEEDRHEGTTRDARDRLEDRLSNYAPPATECPLFVTWSKLRRGSDHPPPPLPLSPPREGGASSSSGVVTPASTTASSSNVTSDDDASSAHDDSDYDLRGCIGTLAPRPLDRALSEFAITSALHDQRFDPIALHEVPHLRVGVSLLVRYEECEDPLDWEVGVHGIIIKFEAGSASGRAGRSITSSSDRTYSATYLPEVAHEQGWSQREAVTSLVRKAGYRGSVNDELLSRIRCTRYQSSKRRLSYREYAAGRQGGGAEPPREASLATAAAVDEAMRRRARGTRPCVNL